jgi:hypothetical protein
VTHLQMSCRDMSLRHGGPDGTLELHGATLSQQPQARSLMNTQCHSHSLAVLPHQNRSSVSSLRQRTEAVFCLMTGLYPRGLSSWSAACHHIHHQTRIPETQAAAQPQHETQNHFLYFPGHRLLPVLPARRHDEMDENSSLQHTFESSRQAPLRVSGLHALAMSGHVHSSHAGMQCLTFHLAMHSGS